MPKDGIVAERRIALESSFCIPWSSFCFQGLERLSNCDSADFGLRIRAILRLSSFWPVGTTERRIRQPQLDLVNGGALDPILAIGEPDFDFSYNRRRAAGRPIARTM